MTVTQLREMLQKLEEIGYSDADVEMIEYEYEHDRYVSRSIGSVTISLDVSVGLQADYP